MQLVLREMEGHLNKTNQHTKKIMAHRNIFQSWKPEISKRNTAFIIQGQYVFQQILTLEDKGRTFLQISSF